ncbi:MAG: histidinol-phosphate transaminase [Candidatus Latescibacteria bacterium]|nr:histidinol-phosphate transaminase [Candidatus Latescibacterota bacterium]
MTGKSVTECVKPCVRDIAAYTLREYDHEIKINQNENPQDVPADIKRGILDFAMTRSWSRYPPFNPSELRGLLADYSDWTADGVLVGNGSNEIIQALMEIFLSPGDALVLPSPTFTVYRLVGTVLGAEVVNVPLKTDYSFDCDALERTFLERGRMLVLCSPNNPTGGLYPRESLERILAATNRPVIVDEAYFEFSKETAAGLLSSHDNLVVLRTFSKAFSLAGLRVGYGLMGPELAREANKAKLPYNINFFTIAAAVKLLRNRSRLEPAVDEIIDERRRMIAEMNGIDGIDAYPSRANFILFETELDVKKVFEGLLADGLLIRDVSSYPMLGRALRVTVSTRGDNDRFLGSLRRVMAERT